MRRAVRSVFVAVLALPVLSAAAAAQTTLVLSDPAAEVTATTLRGGDYADLNLAGDLLATRASDTESYERRALLKFDTHTTIPAGSTITSATLTLYVHWGGVDDSRRVGAYYVTAPFDAAAATWNSRSATAAWSSPGGDLSDTEADEAVVGNVPGSPVTFDLTDLVQTIVDGRADGSSRYTRIALVDTDAPSRSSYRDYYPPTEPDASLRPVLTVTYSASPLPPPAPTPAPDPAGLRVMHWNTHHGGYRTDGAWDVAGLIAWVIKLNPDVVSLNEVELNDGYSHGEDDAQLYAALLRQLTGDPWNAVFVVGSGAPAGIGNAILSKLPFQSTSVNYLSSGRAAIQAAVVFKGRTINLFSTHLDDKSSAARLNEIGDLLAWAGNFPDARIIAGDFNASESTTEHSVMSGTYVDAWAAARANHTAIAYPGNTAGNTRNGRIDYIFTSKSATELELDSVQVFDTRDVHGVMPSDHRPLLAIYTVK